MERILAIQVKQIGDLVLTIPALRVLRRRFPEARITLVVRELCAPLAPLFPFVSEVLVHRPLTPNLRLAALALPPRYDLSLDFSGTDRAVYCTVLGRARKRATFNKYAEGGFRKRVFNLPVKGQLRDRHAADYCLALLAGAGIDDPGPEPLLLTLPPGVADHLDWLLYDRRVGKLFSVVHPGTARQEKYWSAEKWSTLIGRLLERERGQIVITGGRDPLERAHIEEILGRSSPAQRERIVDLSGRLTLLESAALISRARLVVGVDTAALHFAAGFRRPLVALFGPTNPFQWGPRQENALVVMPGQPEPLSAIDFRPETDLSPMSGLSVDQVEGAIARLAPFVAEDQVAGTRRAVPRKWQKQVDHA